MQARVIRLYVSDPPPRYVDFSTAPAGELSVYLMGQERQASLTVNPSSPRPVLPTLRRVELDGLNGDRLRLKGFEVAGGVTRELVWLCEIVRA